jgi:hypothetical protein
MRPILVGEDNPYSADPRLALWPSPEGCAGWRLCYRILGMEFRDYLRSFERVNLCTGRWSLREARRRAVELSMSRAPSQTLVLLGARVCSAFERPYIPLTSAPPFLVLPHPSGRCRTWNDSQSIEDARRLVGEVLCRS